MVRRRLPEALLCLLLSANAPFLWAHARRAAGLWRRTRGLSEDSRRLLIYGPLYAQLQAARRDIPEDSQIWWVSPDLPWLVNVFLCPRRLNWGSPRIADLEIIRKSHVHDWTAVYHEGNGRSAGALIVYPPFEAGG
jgi:hypothetical protein